MIGRTCTSLSVVSLCYFILIHCAQFEERMQKYTKKHMTQKRSTNVLFVENTTTLK